MIADINKSDAFYLFEFLLVRLDWETHLVEVAQCWYENSALDEQIGAGFPLQKERLRDF